MIADTAHGIFAARMGLVMDGHLGNIPDRMAGAVQNRRAVRAQLGDAEFALQHPDDAVDIKDPLGADQHDILKLGMLAKDAALFQHPFGEIVEIPGRDAGGGGDIDQIDTAEMPGDRVVIAFLPGRDEQMFKLAGLAVFGETAAGKGVE